MSSPSRYAPTTDITDLQYAVVQCGMSLDMVARRTGMTVGNLMRELQESTVPDWLVASVKRQSTDPRGSLAA